MEAKLESTTVQILLASKKYDRVLYLVLAE